MKLKLDRIRQVESQRLQITGSKSETNRLLILQALYPEIEIENISNSDDSNYMQKALASDKKEIDIHHAGTAMRFLTAYFAIQQDRKTILTGSDRMKERPIHILVEALDNLGCQINYVENEGFPPLEISGTIPSEQQVTLKANVSSQYISALMLIASSLPEGLTINLEGKTTSIPYINMTLSLLKEIGIKGSFEDQSITIKPIKVLTPNNVIVESDWSSASYFYSIVALSENASITLGSYKKSSIQGDSILSQLYQDLGVDTIFENNTITLRKKNSKVKDTIDFDLSNSPDLAQTIVVTCFGLNKECNLSGLHTLKIKETDRLVALRNEIEKLGGEVKITNDSLHLKKGNAIREEVSIDTYKDHRMAMAFAPLALRTSLYINEADVVSKSYPDFWDDLKKIGFKMNKNI